MTKPIRIQRKRTKGWKMPPNTVSVTRPGVFGNPFKATDAVEAGYDDGPGMAKWAFHGWLNNHPDLKHSYPEKQAALRGRLSELRGKNLACFCALDQPCHADVLLELANA